MTSASQIRDRTADTASVHRNPAGRHQSVSILFVRCNSEDVERYARELRIVGFKVIAESALTPEEFAERLRAQPYDIVVAKYPGANGKGAQLLELLHESQKHVPLIFVSETFEPELAADLITRGAYDCIEMESIGHLPVATRRALNEGNLRGERDRAEKMLKHSEAKYRALIGNLTYGICRCSLDGNFLDVNQALITMLGYTSREELLAANLASTVILDPKARARLLGQAGQMDETSLFETEWKRSNGTAVRVRLSAREVCAEQGVAESYEVIVEDVTKQRALEDHLRQQATRDALTGLANYRQLVDVLSTEIKRTQRTGREFALLLLDLNGLKQINDRHGHFVGSKALCRLADALCNCSRDIDTAARFGGDEFALVLPETGAEAAGLVAQRICNSLANDAKEPRVSVSVGIAIHPAQGKTIETLLCAADRALYKMKGASGAATVKIFTDVERHANLICGEKRKKS
jgi:two-component system cell cycle response regulator